MTSSARDSLIAIVFLWVLFGVIVFFRLLGRIQGVGIGPDDLLSLTALVCGRPFPPKFCLIRREWMPSWMRLS